MPFESLWASFQLNSYSSQNVTCLFVNAPKHTYGNLELQEFPTINSRTAIADGGALLPHFPPGRARALYTDRPNSALNDVEPIKPIAISKL